MERAQSLCQAELGYELPQHILEKAWVGSVDISALFAWCVFQSHQLTSNEFFNSDPIEGSENSQYAKYVPSHRNKYQPCRVYNK